MPLTRRCVIRHRHSIADDRTDARFANIEKTRRGQITLRVLLACTASGSSHKAISCCVSLVNPVSVKRAHRANRAAKQSSAVTVLRSGLVSGASIIMTASASIAANARAQSCRLTGLGRVPPRRPAVIVNQRTIIVKKTVEPVHIICGDPHLRFLSISSHARLIATIRRSASLIASSGTPRAIIWSGWVSRTSLRHAARTTFIGASGSTPRMS